MRDVVMLGRGVLSITNKNPRNKRAIFSPTVMTISFQPIMMRG